MNNYAYIPIFIAVVAALALTAFAVVEIQTNRHEIEKTNRLVRALHSQNQELQVMFQSSAYQNDPKVSDLTQAIDNLHESVEQINDVLTDDQKQRPTWDENTTLDQGQRMLRACFAERFGAAITLLALDYQDIEALIDQMAQQANKDKKTALAAAGIMFGCWDYSFATKYGTAG